MIQAFLSRSLNARKKVTHINSCNSQGRLDISFSFLSIHFFIFFYFPGVERRETETSSFPLIGAGESFALACTDEGLFFQGKGFYGEGLTEQESKEHFCEVGSNVIAILV